MTTKDHEPEIDALTGIRTTGHNWDGLTELNQPLPRWWLWIFYATIIWSIGYWIVYPAWPLVSSFTGGVLGWHSRAAVVADMDALKAKRGPSIASLAATPLADVEKDPALLDFTLAYGRVAFKENCVPCHGAGGGGALGYPNLIDDDWLWGGTTEAVEATIAHGVRNEDPDSRQSLMPAFGKEGLLSPGQIAGVTAHVRSLAGLDVDKAADLTSGATVFAENCASCHGEDAKGNRDLGAPNLTDAVWLYGSTPDAVTATITNARNSSMPAWGPRLDPTTIKALTYYVHALGGGE